MRGKEVGTGGRGEGRRRERTEEALPQLCNYFQFLFNNIHDRHETKSILWIETIFCFLLFSQRLVMARQLRIQGRFGFRNVQLIKTEEHSLGIGSYGAVYKVKCDQLVCAAKVLHPILFQTRDPAAYRIVQRFEQEIEFLSGLKHPNVIQYLGSCRDPESGLPIMFMELMDESLTSFLERPANPPPLPLHIQVNIAHDVAQALSHLHHHEVLHRDLSSNNVLLIGDQRAKVTDFGMAKLLGTDPRLTPTYCPGTNGYMSPEALADPPSYTTKLDIFSCGVLFVQLITRKFPDPGPRTYTVELNDPRVPSGRVLVEVPELERRKAHIDPIDPTHPLQRVALDCLKDKEEPRPTAEQLCSRLIALKGSTAYQDSLQQKPEELAAQTPPARVELEQQLREREDRVEDLTRQVEQLQLQSREDAHQKYELVRQKNMLIQQKDELIRQKDEAIAYLRRQLQATRQENEQVVAALQQSVEQKDQLLQEKERQIQELQQSREECDAGPLKLEWRDGPRTPFGTFGEFVAVSEGMAYCRDGVSGTLLMYNSKAEWWTVLPECSKKFFSIAVVNGLLTAIGGRHSNTHTKTLLSLSHDRLLGISRQKKWIEQFPPMTYYHNNPAVVTTDISLIVAGGWGPDRDKAPVEVMDTKTLRWSTVASLPHPRSQAIATICGGRMYIGGGSLDHSNWTKSVLMCEVSDLLQSPPGRSRASQVWREIAELQHISSSLITLRGQLLAIGGCVTVSGEGETSEVRQYDVITNSWKVISHMTKTRHQCFAAVLTNDRVMVVGGWLPGNKGKDNVEIASIV